MFRLGEVFSDGLRLWLPSLFSSHASGFGQIDSELVAVLLQEPQQLSAIQKCDWFIVCEGICISSVSAGCYENPT